MNFPFLVARSRNVTASDLMGNMKNMMRRNSGRYVRPRAVRNLYGEFCLFRHIFLDPKIGIKPRTTEELRRATEAMSDVVHYLLERFYWMSYGNSEWVVDLLRELYRLDGHLGKIFDFQQLVLVPLDTDLTESSVTKRTRSEQTTWGDRKVHDQRVQPVQYFLEHAGRMRAVFRGRRLAETHFLKGALKKSDLQVHLLFQPPCSLTLLNPWVLAVLLQHGLFATCGPRDADVAKLLTGIIGVVLTDGHKADGDGVRHLLEAGNALLRAVPSVDPRGLLKAQKFEDREAEVLATVQKMSRPGCLPMLGQRCQQGPQDLQHLCRREIRWCMYLGWSLPHGVWVLPLPQVLKDYVSLRRG